MNRLIGVDKYIGEELKYFYFALSFFAVAANIADLLTLGHNWNFLFFIYNYVTIGVIILSFVSFLFFKIPLRIAFLISILSIFINLIISNLTDIVLGEETELAILLLRQTVFACFLLTVTFLFIGQFWGLLLGVVYSCYFIFVVIYTNDNFLMNNLFIIIILFVAYVFILNFFQKYFQKAVLTIEEDSIEIREKNEEYLAANQEYMAINEELNESQKQITAQHEELLTLTESISKQNAILEEKNLKLEEAIEQKNRLFSIIAHDLKSPISSTSALTELLLKKYNIIPEEKKINWLNKILLSNKSIYELLENLLLWSRSQTGMIVLKPENINLHETVETIIEVYRNGALSKSIVLVNLIDKESVVVADRMMFETILRNLVSNAMKFSYENGKIELEAQLSNNEIVVSVKDFGVGMQKDFISKLFTFNEMNITSIGTAGEKGTGLGLRICEEFIKIHNGKIWVESEENKGTTFYFSIPVR